jgi:DNA gyrase subunit A
MATNDNLSLIDENGDTSIDVAGVTFEEGDASYAEHLRDAFLLYAASVITDRALPDVRDGLKPVHRRILLAAADMRLWSRSSTQKCAKVVGEAMGNYHPHGDSSIYDALVRLAQDFSMRVPLIDGQGAFGSIDGAAAAAMRYTECRLSPAAEALLADLPGSKKEVELILPNDTGRNYTGQIVEPRVLPARIPNLLINGTTGIAVGMATSMLPHNPAEVMDLCMWRLQNPDAPVEKVAKRLSGPDLPTGGLIVNNDGLRSVYLTGQGKVTVLGKAHIEPIEGNRSMIVITELPYGVRKGGDGGFIEKLAKLYHEDKFPEFSDLSDMSAEDIRIEIQLKRGSNANAVLARIYKETELSKNFGVQQRALVNGRPKVLNLAEMVDEFLNFRRDILVNVAKKRMGEIELRLHKLDALIKAIDAIDAVIRAIRGSRNREEAKPKIQKILKVDEQQAQWVVELPLGNLTALETKDLKDEQKNLRSELKHLQKFIRTPAMVTEKLLGDLRDLKREYAAPRMSPLIDGDELPSGGDFTAVSSPAEDCLLLVSEQGQAVCGQGTLRRGASLSLATGDRIVCIEPARTDEERLVFTSSGKVCRLRLQELPLENRRSRGESLGRYIGLEDGEKIVAVVPMPDEKNRGAALFAYRSGTVKRTAWAEFLKATTSGIAAARPNAGDEVIAVIDCPDRAEILLVGSHGYSIRFGANDARVMGRASNGVRGITLPADAEIRDVEVITDTSRKLLLVALGPNGVAYGKRIPLDDIPSQGRGGRGILMHKPKTKYGAPAFTALAQDTDTVIIQDEDRKLKLVPARRVPVGARAKVPSAFSAADKLTQLLIAPAE